MNTVIIQYNAGNIQSVLYALERIGMTAVVTDDPTLIQSADKVIFPGVGEASTAMQYLKERNLDVLISELKQPVLGKSMVEGRISAGVVVGDGSDIGGGASIMGTLSGGGKEVISIGQRTLLGANSGIGISLGDDCVVEAGIYITAGSKITLPDGKIVKALELSGANNLLFRRNSQSGSLEALPKTGNWSGLNSALHKN